MDKQDKIFKKVAENHTSHVDFEDLWSKLEPHVPKEKKDRKALWMWFSFIGVAMLSVIGWRWIHPGTIMPNQEGLNNTISLNTKKVDVTNSHELTNSILGESNQYISNNTKDLLSHVFASTKVHSYNNNRDFAIPKPVFDLKWEESPNTIGKKLGGDDNSNLGVNKVMNLKHIASDSLALEGISSDEKFGIDIQSQRKVDELAWLSLPPQLNIKSLHPVKEISILPVKNNWFNVLIYSGIGKSWVNYSNQKDPRLLQKMNQSEKGMEFLNFGCSIEKKVFKRWAVNAGLRYGRLVSEVNNKTTALSPFTTEGAKEVVIDSFGNQNQLTGKVDGYQLTTTTSRWFTYHHQLELPVNIKYSLFKHRGHNISLLGGFALPIWMHTEGSYYNAEGSWKKVSGTDTYLADRLSWQYGMDWEWRLFKNGSIQTSLINETKKYSLIHAPTQSVKNISIWYMNLGYRHYF